MVAVHSVRQLTQEDWGSYSKLRLAALLECPGLFGSSYETEAAYDEGKWRAWPSVEKAALFGVFVGGELIGQAGVMQDMEIPEHAFLLAAYIKPAYRGKSYAEPLYEARMKWAREQRFWKKIGVGHRDGNHPVRHMVTKLGFKETERRHRVWPDSTEGDLVLYVCEL